MDPVQRQLLADIGLISPKERDRLRTSAGIRVSGLPTPMREHVRQALALRAAAGITIAGAALGVVDELNLRIGSLGEAVATPPAQAGSQVIVLGLWKQQADADDPMLVFPLTRLPSVD